MITVEKVFVVITFFLALLIFFIGKEMVYKRAGEENMIRTVHGLPCKRPLAHVLDFLLGRTFTQLALDYADRNAFVSVKEGYEKIGEELREKERAKSVQK